MADRPHHIARPASGGVDAMPAAGVAALAVTLIAVLIVAIARGGEPTSTFRFTRFAMGTVVEYTIRSASHADARTAVEAAHVELERVASVLDERRHGSPLSRVNADRDSILVPAEAADFLRRALKYATRSGGAFDVSLGPVLDLYAFDANRQAVPSGDEIAAGLDFVGGIYVEGSVVRKRRAGAGVTAGGVAKGYAVDRAVEVLRAHDITSAVVSAGGDLYALGTRDGEPWRVGIRHPREAGRIVAVLEVSDAAVATSGDYERYFERDGVRYHHLIDPANGRPARELRSASVVATTSEEADAMATAVFVLGEHAGLDMARRLGLEALVVDSTGAMAYTDRLRVHSPLR